MKSGGASHLRVRVCDSRPPSPRRHKGCGNEVSRRPRNHKLRWLGHGFAQESSSAGRTAPIRFLTLGPVGADGSWRNGDAKFEGQLRGNTRFALSWILLNHLRNQVTQVSGDPRPVASGLPDARKTEMPAMPTDERFRLYDHQSVSSIRPPRPEQHGESGGISQSLGLDVPFAVEGQLFPEEHVLSDQRGSGAQGDLSKMSFMS